MEVQVGEGEQRVGIPQRQLEVQGIRGTGSAAARSGDERWQHTVQGGLDATAEGEVGEAPAGLGIDEVAVDVHTMPDVRVVLQREVQQVQVIVGLFVVDAEVGQADLSREVLECIQVQGQRLGAGEVGTQAGGVVVVGQLHMAVDEVGTQVEGGLQRIQFLGLEVQVLAAEVAPEHGLAEAALKVGLQREVVQRHRCVLVHELCQPEVLRLEVQVEAVAVGERAFHGGLADAAEQLKLALGQSLAVAAVARQLQVAKLSQSLCQSGRDKAGIGQQREHTLGQGALDLQTVEVAGEAERGVCCRYGHACHEVGLQVQQVRYFCR